MSVIVRGDIIGGDTLEAKLGVAEAKHAVERCLKRVERAGAAQQGRLLGLSGNAITMAFPELDDACLGATDMQKRVSELPPLSSVHLSLRTAICAAHDENDAIRMAGMLLERVMSGQILCDRDLFQNAAEASGLKIRDIEEEWMPRQEISAMPIPLMEINWRESLYYGKTQARVEPYQSPFSHQIDEITLAPDPDGDGLAFSVTLIEPSPNEEPEPVSESVSKVIPRLCIRYGEKTFLMGEDTPVLTLGREHHNDIVIRSGRASRAHARIVLREKRYTLEDTSTNGTFVTQNGEAEIFVRNTIIILRNNGIFSLGLPTYDAKTEKLEFEYLP